MLEERKINVMKIEKSEEKIDVVIVGKEELQEGVAATGTAVEELEYLLENCGFIRLLDG